MMKYKYCNRCKTRTKVELDDFNDKICSVCKRIHTPTLPFKIFMILIAILFISLLYITYPNNNENQEINPNPNNFTQEQIDCLSKQYKFYGVDQCSFCQDQKTLLGQVIVDMSYIDCLQNKFDCDSKRITAYPFNVMFHKNTGELTMMPGLTQIDTILESTGCDLK